MLKKIVLAALVAALAVSDADARGCRAKRTGPIRRIFAAVRPQRAPQAAPAPVQTSRAVPDSPSGPVFVSSSPCANGVCPIIR